MNVRLVFRSFLAILAACLACGEASAGARASIASTGNDANPCTIAQPCRLLPAALAIVDDGGEIWMLDSANFNTAGVSITKSVSILAIPGALGSVLATGGGAAFSINVPSGAVKLRNLIIRSLGAVSGTGISVTTVGSLVVEGVTVERLSFGLLASGQSTISIVDSALRSNQTAVQLSQSGSAQMIFNVDRTLFFENITSVAAFTVGATGFLRVTIDNSVIDGFGNFGNGMTSFGAQASPAPPIRASLMRTKFMGRGTNNGAAVTSYGADSIVTISDCHFAGFPVNAVTALNGATGVGVLRSLGNNTLAEGSFAFTTTVAPQ